MWQSGPLGIDVCQRADWQLMVRPNRINRHCNDEQADIHAGLCEVYSCRAESCNMTGTEERKGCYVPSTLARCCEDSGSSCKQLSNVDPQWYDYNSDCRACKWVTQS